MGRFKPRGKSKKSASYTLMANLNSFSELKDGLYKETVSIRLLLFGKQGSS
ncbi:hypothetical protein YC2023_099091 [Brassica napus]